MTDDEAPHLPAASPQRREELKRNLSEVRQRIADATRSAGRDEEPRLVVVTKFFGVEDLIALAELGVGDVGENREQELHAKVEHLRENRPDLMSVPRRHFIGQIQSKKAKRIARDADVVQSVDRVKLVPLLDDAAAERGEPLEVLVQVDLEQDSHGRGGVAPAGVAELADVIAAAANLRLGGVMAVAPLGEDPRRAFADLARIHGELLREHPDATTMSAGMSGDLEVATQFGATHLRVGSAILGSRPTPR